MPRDWAGGRLSADRDFSHTLIWKALNPVGTSVMFPQKSYKAIYSFIMSCKIVMYQRVFLLTVIKNVLILS